VFWFLNKTFRFVEYVGFFFCFVLFFLYFFVSNIEEKIHFLCSWLEFVASDQLAHFYVRRFAIIAR
jgi:hypothetical protein